MGWNRSGPPWEVSIDGPGVVVHVGTWADKPAATDVTEGSLIEVTDVGVGRSYWYSNGTKWRTVAPLVLTEYYNASGLVFAANTAETLMSEAEVLLPAALLSQGARLFWETTYTHATAAENRIARLRLGAASGVAGTEIGSYASTSTSAVVDLGKVIKFVSDTATYQGAQGNITYAVGGTAVTSSGLATSGALYLSPTFDPSATNAMTVYALRVTLDV